MAAISLKLPDHLLVSSQRYAHTLRVSRAAYIRRAIEQMNRETLIQLRAKRLAEVSKKVRKESLRVARQFAVIERDPDA